MSAKREIPAEVTSRQTEASAPESSAWVSANAGSGKTHVLAQRVIRLLLSGVEPARILCITFTKAAAANMSNRVFGDLRKWTLLDDAALNASMSAAGVARPSPALRQRARRLFALALETPGGLKVQTIHAFCTQLLHRFPFEANVAARFEVLDDVAGQEMLDGQTFDVMLEAADTPDSALGRALQVAVLASADVTFQKLVRGVIGRRDDLEKWIADAGGLANAMAQLSRALGVEPDDTASTVEAAFFGESLIAASEWTSIARVLAAGTKTDAAHAARFDALGKLAAAARLETYLEIFCTGTRDKPREKIGTKTIQDSEPALCRQLMDERDRVWALVLRQRAIAARDRSMALFTIAHAVIARVRAEKNRLGRLDYEDLIEKTLELLNKVSAAWVHYKLDQGIHHVLIDEAQDTSPQQWDIVKALVAEFFAGKGQHDRPRTIFAVGDEKQSIFSFQGAAPEQFADMRRHFENAHKRAGLIFVPTEFKHSFRSGPNVLGAVDTVFSHKAAFEGLTAGGGATVHESLPSAAPGLVEIWNLEQSDPRDDPAPWDAPFDRPSATSGPVKLARRIAGNIAAWLRQGRSPKDVLILVRRRGALFEAVIRALKTEKIPVAGADRLVLTDHIAVMDLMVLADALLLPEDDLALATVLKSPLFGLDDDALFALAWNRPGSLRAALGVQRPDLAAAFDALAAAARRQTPFVFYAGLLGAGGGRKKILARLGHEASDALDEFLNLALDYERAETPSLQGFVDWLRKAETEIKRDMELARDEVRVMTVHGAKGLEAPIVVLADTTTPPEGWHHAGLMTLPPASKVPGAPSLLVWATAAKNDTAAMAEARKIARDKDAREYRRLLYVAMTRAIDRLIVCGVEGSRKRPEGCWYDLVNGALADLSQKEPGDHGPDEVLRYRKQPDLPKQPGKAAQSAPPARGSGVPAWLRTTAGPEPARAEAIKPSGFVEDIDPAVRAGRREARERAIARGLAVHRLLQSLPDVPAERRAATAAAYLGGRKDVAAAEHAGIAKQVLAILADPGFAALFGPDSRAEVSIAGRMRGQPVAGQVDRLVVTPAEILIADYKSNRPPPRSVAEALSAYGSYVKQLALYRDMLARVYPGRPVRAALVWTETPELMEIPAAALDEALNEALNIAVTNL